MKQMNTRYELCRRDGKIWCRPIDAPRSEPWRPVDGARSLTEAAATLRAQGERVTRQRSGN